MARTGRLLLRVDRGLLARIDALAGAGGRSAWVREAIEGRLRAEAFAAELDAAPVTAPLVVEQPSRAPAPKQTRPGWDTDPLDDIA